MRGQCGQRERLLIFVMLVACVVGYNVGSLRLEHTASNTHCGGGRHKSTSMSASKCLNFSPSSFVAVSVLLIPALPSAGSSLCRLLPLLNLPFVVSTHICLSRVLRRRSPTCSFPHHPSPACSAAPPSAFGRMDGLKVPFRSSSQQFSLDSFSCRFVRGSSMSPAPASEGDTSLADIAVRATAAATTTTEGGVLAAQTEAEAEVLLDSSAVEDQVSRYLHSTAGK